ncbi:sensor histidine kinase [Roseateles aquatilis]|uniref:sensor histidine kinase n=1 Tax=Roseateles aquatilis TaxID=431061 RepID=UPI001EDEFBD5|nr:sensor histidine kinase [Roseateles aquatilis]
MSRLGWPGLPAGWHRLSVRRMLLTLVLPVMLGAVGIELALTWGNALQAANSAYDRSLLGAIKAIDGNVSTETGGLSVELPYRMLEFFELTASGQVFFRVSTEDGLVEVGNAGLPLPTQPLPTGVPRFIDATYFGAPVRVGAWAREVDPERPGRRMIIQVAESTTSRNAFSRALLMQAVWRDLLTVVIVTGTLALVIGWALRPLDRLRREVEARADDDLSPVDETQVPADAAPLVRAINHHLARQRELIDGRRRFVDDASHQLRTPLATLATLVGYARRERDPARVSEALTALKREIDDTVRRTNQMLALARADLAELSLAPIDLNRLADRCARECWPQAREHGVDLGFERAPDEVMVLGHEGQLREALLNLLHNALRYTPPGGQVTVQVGSDTGDAGGTSGTGNVSGASSGQGASLRVVDDGPGIPADERPRAGERFFRGSNVDLPGSGLGLAIVRAIVRRHQGDMEVAPARIDGDGRERGTAVTLRLPPHGSSFSAPTPTPTPRAMSAGSTTAAIPATSTTAATSPTSPESTPSTASGAPVEDGEAGPSSAAHGPA